MFFFIDSIPLLMFSMFFNCFNIIQNCVLKHFNALDDLKSISDNFNILFILVLALLCVLPHSSCDFHCIFVIFDIIL